MLRTATWVVSPCCSLLQLMQQFFQTLELNVLLAPFEFLLTRSSIRVIPFRLLFARRLNQRAITPLNARAGEAHTGSSAVLRTTRSQRGYHPSPCEPPCPERPCVHTVS